MIVRLIKKDGWLIFLFFLCIIVMLLCNMRIEISCSVEWLKFLKEAAFCIAGGYIAGYIFYIFSVYVPQSKRLPAVYSLIDKQIIYAKSELMDLSYNVCGQYELKAKLLLSKLAEVKSEDNFVIPQTHCRYLAFAMANIKKFLDYPISKIELLESNDLKNLCEVIKIVTKIHSQVIDVQPNCMYFGKKEYEEFVKNIVLVDKLLETIQNNLKNII